MGKKYLIKFNGQIDLDEIFDSWEEAYEFIKSEDQDAQDVFNVNLDSTLNMYHVVEVNEEDLEEEDGSIYFNETEHDVCDEKDFDELKNECE